jgi:hypothetical protein
MYTKKERQQVIFIESHHFSTITHVGTAEVSSGLQRWGMFAETSSVDYRLSPTKETNVRFSFAFATNKRKFAVSVCSKQMEVVTFH